MAKLVQDSRLASDLLSGLNDYTDEDIFPEDLKGISPRLAKIYDYLVKLDAQIKSGTPATEAQLTELKNLHRAFVIKG